MNSLKRNGQLTDSFPLLFNDFFTRDLYDWNQSNFSNTGTTVPAVNIKETKDSFEVEMAAPGMTKDDFKIHLDGNLLMISAEKNREAAQNNDSRYFKREFSYESFQRSFTLSKDVVDSDKINAKYQDGVLKLLISKKEEAKEKPPRMIQVS